MAALIAACGFASAADEVLSKNAVGYIKVSVEADTYALIGGSFIPMTTNSVFTVKDVLGDTGFPPNTKVQAWNPVELKYDTSIFYNDEYGWYPEVSIDPAQGFWVKPLGQAHDFYFMGEVPAEDVSFSALEGYQIVTFPFPVAISVTNTAFDTMTNIQDKILVQKEDGSGYFTYIKYQAPYGWVSTDDGAPADLTFVPGKAVWYKSTSDVNWVETKPYAWP